MWARGGVDTSEAHKDLEAFGAPKELIEKLAEESKPKDFEIWPENWKAVEVFMRLHTQWKYGAMGGVIGLDYSSLPFIFEMLEVDNKKETFQSIQIMENAALEVLNEKRD